MPQLKGYERIIILVSVNMVVNPKPKEIQDNDASKSLEKHLRSSINLPHRENSE